jgi:hypothetical protein
MYKKASIQVNHCWQDELLPDNTYILLIWYHLLQKSAQISTNKKQLNANDKKRATILSKLPYLRIFFLPALTIFQYAHTIACYAFNMLIALHIPITWLPYHRNIQKH